MSEMNNVKKPSFAYALGTIVAVFAVIMIPALALGFDTKYVSEEKSGQQQ